MKTSSIGRRRLAAALQKALTPIANALLKVGFGYREFDEAAKRAFVNSAVENHGKNGRPGNTSLVSRITGLSRMNVSRIRDTLTDSIQISDDNLHILTRVIDYWFTDFRFCDDNGSPMALSVSGESNSLEALCSMLDVDISPEKVLRDLLATETVTATDGGKYLPIRHWVQPTDEMSRLEAALFMPIYSLARTVDHNLNSPRDSTRLERIVHMHIGDSDSIRRIRKLSQERSSHFVESINDLYGAYESSRDDASAPHAKIVGIGVFYFEHDEYWQTQSKPILKS